jgi:ribonuclease P protein component
MQQTNRLRSNEDFQRIRREGRAVLHPLLVLSISPNDRPYSRFGFAVGRRLGTAAVRNRLKRRLREAVRLRIARHEVAAGWDIVVIARSPLREATFRDIDDALGVLLRRAELVYESP